MTKVLVLGGSGMLGSMVVDFLSKRRDIELTASFRNFDKRKMFRDKYKDIKFLYIDFENPVDYTYFDEYLTGYDYIVNCIGSTKPDIDDNNFESIDKAIKINSILPYYLKSICENSGTILIQILTDCVFSGMDDYVYKDEISKKDAFDVYGKSKIAGEFVSRNVVNLRTSIIGPEFNGTKFLLEWFLKNESEEVYGHINSYWNGITTLAFAKIVYGIIKTGNVIEPSNKIVHIFSHWYRRGYPFRMYGSKYDLLILIKKIFKKKIDIIEKSIRFENPIEKEYSKYIIVSDGMSGIFPGGYCSMKRLLSTGYQKIVKKLWNDAGYKLNKKHSPDIKYLLRELKEYMENEWVWK